MKLALDQYAYLDSPLHRWQQSYKLVGLLSLIFAFACIQNLWLLPAMIAITAVLFRLSQLPGQFLRQRLRYPSWFLLGIVLLLPFVAGETILFSWHNLSIRQEGCLDALLISVRFFCILTVSLILFGTAPFLSSVKGMKSLGLPQVIVDMTLLSYRYLEELGDMVTTMQRAMKLRGFQFQKFSRRHLRIMAQLAGSILVRSYERSLLVYQAMILRGYGSKAAVNQSKKIKRHAGDTYSLLATAITVALAILLLVMEIILSKL